MISLDELQVIHAHIGCRGVVEMIVDRKIGCG
jgi:hypothetical protein